MLLGSFITAKSQQDVQYVSMRTEKLGSTGYILKKTEERIVILVIESEGYIKIGNTKYSISDITYSNLGKVYICVQGNTLLNICFSHLVNQTIVTKYSYYQNQVPKLMETKAYIWKMH